MRFNIYQVSDRDFEGRDFPGCKWCDQAFERGDVVQQSNKILVCDDQCADLLREDFAREAAFERDFDQEDAPQLDPAPWTYR